MHRFALVGKNIQHSKSPEIYRRLISPAITYDLLDYSNEKDIPAAKELLEKYDGINITSPYKKHFQDQVALTDSAKKTGAINCLRKKNGILEGDNTDYKAIVDILSAFKKQRQNLEVVILGDGVMSRVTQIALDEVLLSYKTYSRKMTKDFDQLNLESLPSENLIINTCAREFVFRGKIHPKSIFWDFNYAFPEHASTLPAQISLYLDGLSMLERQAQYAVAFWSEK